jgi:EmrB/QacA subfamily drug resistance transporter
VTSEAAVSETAKGSGFVLLVLAAGQFLMTLDSTVMNVSIAQVANDVHTTVSGIQTAITLYTLVMASLMITGSKVGSVIGRRRAFSIGLVIYGIGSGITAAAPNLTVLIVGWSFFEGIGAALIMPAIVALVAGNFAVEKRPAAYGSIAAAGAIAVAVGPLLGGAVTTFASWRWVFVGEVVVVLVILAVSRKIKDAPPEKAKPFDFLGAALSIVGLALIVLGVLRSSAWGFIRSKPSQPSILGLSPVFWMILAGLLVLLLFFLHQRARVRQHREPLVEPDLFKNRQVVGGLTMFFFQFLAQAGVFFTIPLFLSVVLELSALQTGVRLVPLSVALLLAALLVPRVLPRTSPRLIVRSGLLLMIAGTAILIFGISPSAGAGVVIIPMVLLGLGIGCLASQLGAVTVSAVPESQATDIGGLQNTAMNLGASLGTALAGAVLIASLTNGLVGGISQSSDVSAGVKAQSTTEIQSNVAFVSDTQLQAALNESTLSSSDKSAIMAVNSSARINALDNALGVILGLEVLALFFTGLLPNKALGKRKEDAEAAAD